MGTGGGGAPQPRQEPCSTVRDTSLKFLCWNTLCNPRRAAGEPPQPGRGRGVGQGAQVQVVPVAVDRLLRHRLVTVHPLGGAAIADDAEHGVTNHKGQVFAAVRGTAVHDGLYVCDGALVPRPLGVNPLLTISTLAERSCVLLAKRYK